MAAFPKTYHFAETVHVLVICALFLIWKQKEILVVNLEF